MFGLDFSDVLLVPKLNTSSIKSRSEINLTTTYTFKNNKTWTGVPLIASNMDTIGTIEMYYALSPYKIITCFSKHIQPKDFPPNLNPEYFMVSCGTSEEDLQRLHSIMEKIVVKFICLDVANGYLKKVQEVTQQLSALYPKCILVVGNVCTREGVKALINSGADVVKCGIGSGSCCTTRIKTGVGVPQLTCVRLCASSFNHNANIVSDGGIKNSGDVVKAFSAGAKFVMLGGILSGHEECLGEVMEKNNTKYKIFYGMASETAMNKYQKTSSLNSSTYKCAEGKTVMVPYRGPVEKTIQDILGGMRSACTYLNARCLGELTKSNMIQVKQQYNTIFDNYKLS